MTVLSDHDVGDTDAVARVRLARARALDADADERAVERFWNEIEEARAALDAIPVGDEPLPTAFAADWPVEPR
jgi:hypothetical protein